MGFCVLAALQDPREEVMNPRDLFPDKIALRLDEASQVDMVLGEGARDRGANAHLIDPTLPGVAFVRLEGSPMPVRVRAAYVRDRDIDAMAENHRRAGPRLPVGEGTAGTPRHGPRAEHPTRSGAAPAAADILSWAPTSTDG